MTRKCNNQFCDRYITSNNKQIEYCAKCNLYMCRVLRIFNKPLLEMPYKRVYGIISDPRLCKMRNCEYKAFIRGMCKRCYIKYVKNKENS